MYLYICLLKYSHVRFGVMWYDLDAHESVTPVRICIPQRRSSCIVKCAYYCLCGPCWCGITPAWISKEILTLPQFRQFIELFLHCRKILFFLYCNIWLNRKKTYVQNRQVPVRHMVVAIIRKEMSPLWVINLTYHLEACHRKKKSCFYNETG